MHKFQVGLKQSSNVRQITFTMALAIVVANMIGTGVFISLSYQVMSLQTGFSIMVLWGLGGIAALCGALSYGELAAMWPRSGGEYNYLSRIYHPAIGFSSGFVSIVAGFAAPIAASAIAMGEYAVKLFPNLGDHETVSFWVKILACIVILGTSAIHAIDVKKGGKFQNVFTLLKVALILFLIIAGFTVGGDTGISFLPDEMDGDLILSSGFAISLVYVAYSYSGWNASTYIAGEIKDPQRNLPLSLVVGTAVVMVLYLLINAVFLLVVPIDQMLNADVSANPELAVGYLAGKNIFGEAGGMVISGLVAFGLISAVSSMTLAGPRVAKVMGEDFRLFSVFASVNKKNAPVKAIIIQAFIAIFFVLTSTFQTVIQYIGLTLTLYAFLTVAGVIVMRIRKPDAERPYKTWLFPLTPVIFLAISGWMMYYLASDNYVVAIASFATAIAGIIFYFGSGYKKQEENTAEHEPDYIQENR